MERVDLHVPIEHSFILSCVLSGCRFHGCSQQSCNNLGHSFVHSELQVAVAVKVNTLPGEPVAPACFGPGCSHSSLSHLHPSRASAAFLRCSDQPVPFAHPVRCPMVPFAPLALLAICAEALPALPSWNHAHNATENATGLNATNLTQISVAQPGLQIQREEVSHFLRKRANPFDVVNTTEMAPAVSEKFLPFYCSGCLSTNLLCYKYRCRTSSGAQFCSNVLLRGCK